MLVALIPPVAGVMGLTQLNIVQWLLVFGASMLIIPIVEVVKLFQNLKDKKKLANTLVEVEKFEEE